MNENDVKNYLNSFDLDVRKSKDGTWIDQKCAPDVVSYVADVILTYQEDDGSEDYEKEFVRKELMLSEYSAEIIASMGKPKLTTKSNEYDKFFSQPLKLLAYAHVIEITGKKRNSFLYKIVNADLLSYIAKKPQNAQVFLNVYVEKVLRDSGIWDDFELFFNEQIKNNFNKVKKSFIDFMANNTKRGGTRGGDSRDIRRIFTKVLNCLASARRSKGTIRGRLSKDVIQQEDMFYNRRNFYDAYTGKAKDVKRKDHQLPTKKEEKARVKRELNIAKRDLRKYNRVNNDGKSETFYEIALDIDGIKIEKEKIACNELAIAVHHIFMNSEHPEIAAFLENLILLTSGQHLDDAHPNGHTNEIDRLYQYYLLLCKIRRIENDDQNFYSCERLIEVLNEGFRTDVFTGLEGNYLEIVAKIKEFYLDIL